MSDLPDETPRVRNTPETYLGSLRMQYYFPNGRINNDSYKNLKLSPDIPVNSFSLGGDWTVENEYSESGSNAVLECKFTAQKVFLVMRSSVSDGGKIRVLLDGKPLDANNSGVDVVNGFVPITSDRLYNLIDLKGGPGTYLLRIEFTPGVQVFAFTFG